jgi:hypothetical protein
MDKISMNLLDEMSETILTKIYGYGKPDKSDYSEYMLKPADSFFEKLESSLESTVLEKLLCWSMYEAVNIHNTESKVFANQQKLEKLILLHLSNEGEDVDSIKHNCSLLEYLHKKAKDILDEKIQHLISYCIFADKEYVLNGNAYWRQINLAVLEKIYLDSLNYNSNKRWDFPPTSFMMGFGAPVSIGPDYTNGPEYKWNEKERCYEAEVYLPQSDQFRGLRLTVNPVLSNISIDEACDWAHLDFIIKCELDKKTYPRMYKNKSGSARRGVDNLFSLIFRNYANGKRKDNIELYTAGIFHDLFWMWTGEVPKSETGYMEAKPALIYCMYKAIPYLKKNYFDDIFAIKTPTDLKNEYICFKEIQENSSFNLPFNIAASEYKVHQQENAVYQNLILQTDEEKMAEEKKKDEIYEEEYAILCMMLYFLFWDAAKNLPSEEGVGEEELINYFCYEHADLMEKFYKPFIDETWNKEPVPGSMERNKCKRMSSTWIKGRTLIELINLLLERYKINTKITHLDLNVFEISGIEKKTEVLRILLFNFSSIEAKSKDALLNVMDFAGELKERNDLYCQPKRGKKINTTEEADDEIARIKGNRNILRQKDCGFEINKYIQSPVPGQNSMQREYLLTRKLTCRFFSDTDKEYTYEYGNKNFHIKCKENYRHTNKNNFRCKSLYVSERNTARHYIDAYSIQSVLNDEFPVNLLEAFRDAKDFLFELQEEKKNSPTELLIIAYQNDFIERHLFTYAETFNLLDDKTIKDKNIWDEIYTNDKNVRHIIKKKLPDYGDYVSNLGEQYLKEVKWFFKILYCADPYFTDLYYPSIATYLIYLTLSIQDYIS